MAMASGMLPVLFAVALGGTTSQGFVLHGHVVDTTGAPMSGAEVTAVASQDRPPERTRTDAAGDFSLHLGPGTYRVTVGAPGFVDSVESVTASADGDESRQFVLRLPAFAVTVTVRAPRGYDTGAITSGTRTLTPLRDVPQAVT